MHLIRNVYTQLSELLPGFTYYFPAGTNHYGATPPELNGNAESYIDTLRCDELKGYLAYLLDDGSVVIALATTKGLKPSTIDFYRSQTQGIEAWLITFEDLEILQEILRNPIYLEDYGEEANLEIGYYQMISETPLEELEMDELFALIMFTESTRLIPSLEHLIYSNEPEIFERLNQQELMRLCPDWNFDEQSQVVRPTKLNSANEIDAKSRLSDLIHHLPYRLKDSATTWWINVLQDDLVEITNPQGEVSQLHSDILILFPEVLDQPFMELSVGKVISMAQQLIHKEVKLPQALNHVFQAMK